MYGDYASPAQKIQNRMKKEERKRKISSFFSKVRENFSLMISVLVVFVVVYATIFLVFSFEDDAFKRFVTSFF